MDLSDDVVLVPPPEPADHFPEICIKGDTLPWYCNQSETSFWVLWLGTPFVMIILVFIILIIIIRNKSMS